MAKNHNETLKSRLNAAIAQAGTQEAKLNAVQAVLTAEKEEEEERRENPKGTPASEYLTAKDVMKLLEERDAKMMERIEALAQRRSERDADRTLPFEVRDAEKAAHEYGIATLPLEMRMTMGSVEMDEAGIMGEERDVLVSAQKQAGKLYMMSKLCQTHPKNLRRYQPYLRTLKSLHKVRHTLAMDEFTAGEGLEWVPARWTGILLDRIERKLLVAQLFEHFRMTSLSETIGLQGAKPTTYHLGNYPLADNEAAIPASTPGTGNLTFTARDLLCRVVVGTNFTEDSAFNALAIVENMMVRSCQEAIEDALISGDRAAALDPGFVYTIHARTAFDGIRKLIGNAYKYDVTTGASAFESSDTDEVRLLMGANWGSDLTRLAWITSFLGRTRIGLFDDVLTVDKYGPNATILTGEVAKIKGVPIIESPMLDNSFNASGVYDGITTGYTIAICVNRDAFLIGDRKDITMESGKIIRTGQQEMVLTWRGAFERTYGTTEPGIAGLAYKIQ